MKYKLSVQFLLIGVCLFLGNSVQAQWWGSQKKINGNGNVQSESRKLSSFDKISVSAGIDVIYKTGPKSVTVVADENLIELIRTEVEGNTLKVTRAKNTNIKHYKKFEVEVSSPELFAIKTSSGSSFQTIEKIKSSHMSVSSSSGSDIDAVIEAKKMKVKSSSGSDIKLTLLADMVEVDSSSGSDIDLNGSARSVKLSASSGSDIKAKNLTVDNCDASVSSAGEINISVTKNLNATASSGGDIKYFGKPETINKTVSSGGKVEAK